ncbi:MAG: CPBP family intramembrane metalloprotease [Actinomycetota bacterium]|nr:CPBP family intramembrane metalloprotease [Actinomycetota bacterium]
MTDQPAVGDPPEAPLRQAPAWNVGHAAAGFAAAFVLSTVAGAVWVGVSGEQEVTLGLTVAALLGQWTGLVGSAVLVSRRKGTGNLAADLGLRLERADVARGLAVGVACQLILVPLLYLPFSLFDVDVDVSEEAREVTGLAEGPGIAVLALCIVVGAPLAEELFFRGLLQRAVSGRHGPRWGIAVSSVVFGITHFQPVQLLGLVAFGVVLGVLAERAGRLGPSIVAHMAFNATTVVLLVALG